MLKLTIKFYEIILFIDRQSPYNSLGILYIHENWFESCDRVRISSIHTIDNVGIMTITNIIYLQMI